MEDYAKDDDIDKVLKRIEQMEKEQTKQNQHDNEEEMQNLLKQIEDNERREKEEVSPQIRIKKINVNVLHRESSNDSAPPGEPSFDEDYMDQVDQLLHESGKKEQGEQMVDEDKENVHEYSVKDNPTEKEKSSKKRALDKSEDLLSLLGNIHYKKMKFN